MKRAARAYQQLDGRSKEDTYNEEPDSAAVGETGSRALRVEAGPV
jgi:hypothetical protein